MALLMTPVVATAGEDAAVQAAAAGYAQYGHGDYAASAASAAFAVEVQPENLEYRLLWVDALLAADRQQEAYAALQPVANHDTYAVQTRLAQAAMALGSEHQLEAAEAYGKAAALAQDAGSSAYLTRSRISALADAGQMAEAERDLRDAWAQGILPGDSPLDAAYLAARVGADDLAQEAFRVGDASGTAALDAGYSARRLGRDEDAIAWFERGLAGFPGDEDLAPQRRFEIRREIETLQRRWGVDASVILGTAPTTTTGSGGGDEIIQAGADAYWRLGGYNDGRPLDLFVRAFQTIDAPAGFDTGSDTTQGWIGLRYKPFRDTNLVLEASRMFAIGDLARDDTMLRAAWSAEKGGDLRYDRASWPSWRLYADLAHIIEDDQTLGAIDAQGGWTWRSTDYDLLTAGFGVRGYYDSGLIDTTAIGVGPRVSWRHWFRDSEFAAPASYIDLSLGYDFEIDGGDRAEGLRAALTLHY